MQEPLRNDPLYTRLSASIVILENGFRRPGRDLDAADDRQKSQTSTSSFIGFGAQYANNTVSGKPRSSPRSQNASSPPNRQIAPRQKLSKRFNVPHQFWTNKEAETRCFKCGRTGHWGADST